jgi:hypothetical protein
MRTVVLGQPAELTEWLKRRKELGQDRYDETWQGEYHVAPAPPPHHGYVERQLTALLHPRAQQADLVETGPFNLGVIDDFRVPDGGYHRQLPAEVFVTTAAVVLEVASPQDETYAKFDFYARHGVEEVIVADPALRRVQVWRRRSDGTCAAVPASSLLSVEASELAEALNWPPEAAETGP